MTTYIVRRVIQGFLVLVASSFVIYSLLIVTPGGPLDQYYAEIVGMDQVVPKGIDLVIGDWHIKGSGVLTGDFGRSVSLAKGVYVTDLIGDRIGYTLALTGTSLAVSLLIALVIG